nr:hypothetical protein [Streptomyces sp. ISL-10]
MRVPDDQRRAQNGVRHPCSQHVRFRLLLALQIGTDRCRAGPGIGVGVAPHDLGPGDERAGEVDQAGLGMGGEREDVPGAVHVHVHSPLRIGPEVGGGGAVHHDVHLPGQPAVLVGRQAEQGAADVPAHTLRRVRRRRAVHQREDAVPGCGQCPQDRAAERAAGPGEQHGESLMCRHLTLLTCSVGRAPPSASAV